MVIRTPPERPMVLAFGLLDREIVDAGDPKPHRSTLIELPILVAVATEPVSAIVKLRDFPKLAELYGRKVADLQTAFAEPETQSEALEILRRLVERVDVFEDENGFRIDMTGEITQMLKLGSGSNGVLEEPYSSSVKVVAGTRNHRHFLRRIDV
jgi:hypothetical protein